MTLKAATLEGLSPAGMMTLPIYILWPLLESQRPCAVSAELDATDWDGWMDTQ